jgi:hypothetical protein
VARLGTVFAFWRGTDSTNPLSNTTHPACSGSFLKRPAARRRAANQKMDGQPPLNAGFHTNIWPDNMCRSQSEYVHFSNMKTAPDFAKLSTSAGLLVLGAGFVSLGALSFIKRHLQDAESGLLLNPAYPIIGSLISILLGFAFFAIALLFMATRLKEEKAPRKVDRHRNSQPSRADGSITDGGTHSRHGDSFEPEVTFCRHEAVRERPVPASHGSDL